MDLTTIGVTAFAGLLGGLGIYAWFQAIVEALQLGASPGRRRRKSSASARSGTRTDGRRP